MKFNELELKPEILKALSELNYEILTKVQEQSLPSILDGKDLLGIANTGTGKTAAFCLPILNQILLNPKEIEVGRPRCIILAPTRELCAQIGENIQEYSKYSSIKSLVLYGGIQTSEQIVQLREKYDIIVATPIRLYDLMEENLINLETVEFFVLDEADKILELDSRVALKKIFKKLPRKKQSLFFSATMDEKIEELADLVLKSPIKVKVEEKVNVGLIEQEVYFVKKDNKNRLLVELLNKKEVKSAIIFTNSKTSADNLVRYLHDMKIKTESLHSGKSNTHRIKVLEHIKTRHIKYLISTDLASRGLDIENLTHIINYEIPPNPEDYIHRIGRTARCENKGISITLCATDEKTFFDRIEILTKTKMKVIQHPLHDESARVAIGVKSKPKTKNTKSEKVQSNTQNLNRPRGFKKFPQKK